MNAAKTLGHLQTHLATWIGNGYYFIPPETLPEFQLANPARRSSYESRSLKAWPHEIRIGFMQKEGYFGRSWAFEKIKSCNRVLKTVIFRISATFRIVLEHCMAQRRVDGCCLTRRLVQHSPLCRSPGLLSLSLIPRECACVGTGGFRGN